MGKASRKKRIRKEQGKAWTNLVITPQTASATGKGSEQ
jgi:hypothetical protein